MSATAPTTVLFLVQVITDVEPLRPIVGEARRRGVRTRVVVLAKAFRRTPELRRLLAATLSEHEVFDEHQIESGAAPLEGVDAVFSVTESSAPAHRAAHALARHANRVGLRTYTMQHGFESIGLTWFDEEYPPGAVRFESRTIFTWGPLERLHSAVLPETRAKCVAAGCGSAEPPAGLARPGGGGRLLAVFENLHWSRYSPDYRSKFLADLEAAARAHPDATFVVRPHPRGKWLTRHGDGAAPKSRNVLVAASEDPHWTTYCAPALIEFADAVITTPSSVALDAALRGRPVAVAAYGLDLAAYDPLPLLERGADWIDFVGAIGTPRREELARRAGSFAAATVVPGDGAARIVDRLLADARRPAAEQRGEAGSPRGERTLASGPGGERASAAAAGAVGRGQGFLGRQGNP